jgi:hypothetical protein
VPATGNEAERLWRKLYTEFAVLLDLHYTDQQVVDLFYEYGVIDAPIVPAGMKSIRDYVIETLHHGYAIPGFLRVAVPKVVFDLDMEERWRGWDMSWKPLPLRPMSRATSPPSDCLGSRCRPTGRPKGRAAEL